MIKIVFEVQIKSGTRSDCVDSIKPPSQYPCFILNHNYNWNDYGFYTWYSLFYYQAPDEVKFIGELKILHKENKDTNKVIPQHFERLDENYCSLGIRTDYYDRLKQKFSTEECKNILAALQDCSIQIERYEQYKDEEGFKVSLLRDLSSEQAWRKAKFIIKGASLENAYNIHYFFHPKYNPECMAPFQLKFSANAKNYYRCASIIGGNGVGKTTMLSNLINDLINNKEEQFNNNFIPLFSCVMSICTTSFDSFSSIKRSPENNSFFPYYYFCAGQQKDETLNGIITSIKNIRKRKINKKDLFQTYHPLMRKVLPEIADYKLWQIEKNEKGDETFILNEKEISLFLENISSGQLQLFLLITFIFERITFDSLIIIDEPEVHLHPKAIRDLFKLLISLLGLFQSYCIVSTHSPLIIRELPGRNVYLMRRNDNIPEIGKIGIETLGEDISILYNKVFGYDDNETFLKQVVVRMKANGKSYKDIVRTLTDSDKLSLNTRFIVKQIMDYEES